MVNFSIILLQYLDIDECASDTHDCKHQCINNDGSFECRCTPGYALHEDDKSCNGNRHHTCHSKIRRVLVKGYTEEILCEHRLKKTKGNIG